MRDFLGRRDDEYGVRTTLDPNAACDNNWFEKSAIQIRASRPRVTLQRYVIKVNVFAINDCAQPVLLERKVI